MTQVLRHPISFNPGGQLPNTMDPNARGDGINGTRGNQLLMSMSFPQPPTTATFVKKLFDLVTNEPDDLVCWVQNGTAFEIKDPKKLEKLVLPKYFRHSKFKSFARQLCFYSFKNVSHGKRSWIYKHELFRQGHPQLLDLMRRRTASGASKTLADSLAAKALALVDAQQNTANALAAGSVPESLLAKPVVGPLAAGDLVTGFSSPRSSAYVVPFSTPRLSTTGIKRNFANISTADEEDRRFSDFAGPTASPERNKKLATYFNNNRKREEDIKAMGDSLSPIKFEDPLGMDASGADSNMYNELLRYTDLFKEDEVTPAGLSPEESATLELLDYFPFGENIFTPNAATGGEYEDVMAYNLPPASSPIPNGISGMDRIERSTSGNGNGNNLKLAGSQDSTPLSPLPDDVISSWIDGDPTL